MCLTSLFQHARHVPHLPYAGCSFGKALDIHLTTDLFSLALTKNGLVKTELVVDNSFVLGSLELINWLDILMIRFEGMVFVLRNLVMKPRSCVGNQNLT